MPESRDDLWIMLYQWYLVRMIDLAERGVITMGEAGALAVLFAFDVATHKRAAVEFLAVDDLIALESARIVTD